MPSHTFIASINPDMVDLGILGKLKNNHQEKFAFQLLGPVEFLRPVTSRPVNMRAPSKFCLKSAWYMGKASKEKMISVLISMATRKARTAINGDSM